jgi:hypothetical protein
MSLRMQSRAALHAELVILGSEQMQRLDQLATSRNRNTRTFMSMSLRVSDGRHE